MFGGSFSLVGGFWSLLDFFSAPLVIITQLRYYIVSLGCSVTFSVATLGLSPISYQWHRWSTLGVSNPILGATASTLTLANVSRLDAVHYYVTVGNPATSIDSEDGTLALFTLSYLPSLGARM